MIKTNYEKNFPSKGWLLVKTRINQKMLLDLQSFLKNRLKKISRYMDVWIVKNGFQKRSYSGYQKKLEMYLASGLPKDLQHFLKGEFDLQTRLSKKMHKLFANKYFVKTIKQILKAKRIYIHYPPMLRFKYADSPGSILPPHQDFPYSPHLKNFITVWLPLVRISKKVGGLIMYNGSQKLKTVQSNKNKYWSFGIDKKNLRKYEKEQPTLSLGDALVFPSGFVHGSALQLDKKNIRLSIDFRIFTQAEMTTKPMFDCSKKTVVKKSSIKDEK